MQIFINTTHRHTHMHTYTCMHTRVHVCKCTCLYMYTCTSTQHTNTHMHAYTCMHTCVYVYMCTCLYMYTCTSTQHTHTHTLDKCDQPAAEAAFCFPALCRLQRKQNKMCSGKFCRKSRVTPINKCHPPVVHRLFAPLWVQTRLKGHRAHQNTVHSPHGQARWPSSLVRFC